MPAQPQMANQGQQHAADVPAGHRDRQQHALLDAARTLMLLGAVAAVSASAMVGTNPDSDAARVFLVGGFVAWLLGAWLLWLVPVAGWFPGAAALAAAVIASATAVLVRLFTPLN